MKDSLAERLLAIHAWGKSHIKPEELKETIALHMLTNEWQRRYGTSFYVSERHAKTVLAHLRSLDLGAEVKTEHGGSQASFTIPA